MRDGGATEIQQRAANTYVIWPLAVLDLFREPPEATAWSRLHTRQAFVFGIAASFGYVVLHALPLLILIAIPPLAASLTGTVWLYAVGILADVVGAFVLLGLTLRYRERALHGELFSIPYITPIADRLSRRDR